jgi:glycosyltransferase involved in cell wall biosynthesis
LKKVLCIIDVYNWAMHNRVVALEKYLSNQYHFDICLVKNIKENTLNDYDVVYVLNWVLHKGLRSKIKKNGGYRTVTTVCSHTPTDRLKGLNEALNFYDQVSVSSRLLEDSVSKMRKGVIYTPFGVDTRLFRKKTDPCLNSEVFGFVGKTNRPLKRFAQIKHYSDKSGSTLRVASHETGYTREQMVNFYNSIGTLICFSESEGTPNPVLEAAACGRAVISSPVGNVPELFGSKYPLRAAETRADLHRQILFLKRDKKLLKDCSQYLEAEAKSRWCWRARSKAFEELLS